MTKWKDEIEKEIGSTRQAKQNTWVKLNKQQKNKKQWQPIVISIASLAVVALLLLIIINPQLPINGSDKASVADSPTDEQSMSGGTALVTGGEAADPQDALKYTVLQAKEGTPFYIETYEGVVLLEDESAYDYYVDLYKLTPERPINFETHQGLIVAFGTDGCGQEIKHIRLVDGDVEVTFQRPEEIRNQKDYACTSILMPHVQLLEIEKIEAVSASFLHGNSGGKVEVTLNEILVNEAIRDFELFYIGELSGSNVRFLQQPERDKELTIEQTLQLSDAMMQSVRLSGFVDMMEPSILIYFKGKQGEIMVIQVHPNTDKQQITIVPQSNTHAAYVINGEPAKTFYDIIDSLQ